MKRLFLLLLAATTVLWPAAHATSIMPALRAEHGWIRLMPADLPSAGYLVISNLTDTPRQLVSVSSVDFGHVMLHKSDISDGTSHMMHMDAVTVPAHGKVAFEPGGLHLMLMHRRHELKVGQRLIMQLHFADGSTLGAGFDVRPANASGE